MVALLCNWFGAGVLVAAGIGSAAAQGVVRTGFIFENADFPSCHASTLAETPGGLVAAWFGGTEEGHSDVSIYLSMQKDGQWQTPRKIAEGLDPDGIRFPCWNPVLHQAPDGPLVLFYKVGPDPQRWWGVRRLSLDGGKTWGDPMRLPADILGPVKNKPYVLPDGSLLCPSSTETPEKPSLWRIHFEKTTDLGLTWTRSGPLNDGVGFGAIQPSVLRTGPSSLLALGRTTQGKIFRIQSPDLGKTWGEMTALPLPNPNSGTDAVTLRDGRHLLVYNHTSRGRSPLHLSISGDGLHWKAALVLESEPGEFSYPAILQTRDGLVHVTWTWKRQKIRHAVVDPQQLQAREFVQGQWPDP